jgi:hypothetical protein
MSPSPQRRADDDEIQGAEAQQVSQRPATEEEIRGAEAPAAPPTSVPPSRGRRHWRFWRRKEKQQ